MGWKEEFADFVPTGKAALADNEPGKRKFSDRTSHISSEIKLAKPKQDVTSQYRFLQLCGNFIQQIRIHYNIGAEKGSCACPVMKGLECPLCKESRKIYNAAAAASGELQKALKKKAGDLAGKLYYVGWIIDRQNVDAGVQLFQFPPTTYERIYNQLTHPTTKAIRSIDHPIGGHDLFFKKREGIQGSGFLTIEDIVLDTEKSDLGTDAQITEWLRYVKEHDLVDKHMIYVDVDKMSEMLNGGEPSNSSNASDDGFDGQNWDNPAVPAGPAPGGYAPSPAYVNPSPAPAPVQSDPKSAPVVTAPGPSASTSDVAPTVPVTHSEGPAVPAVTPSAPTGEIDIETLKRQLAERPRD